MHHGACLSLPPCFINHPISPDTWSATLWNRVPVASACWYCSINTNFRNISTRYLVETCRWPPTYATCHLIAFHSLAGRIISRLEAILCATNQLQMNGPPPCGDVVAVQSHCSKPGQLLCSGTARMRCAINHHGCQVCNCSTLGLSLLLPDGQ
jgi:hypothetical protein